jgi:hypothetical protein
MTTSRSSYHPTHPGSETLLHRFQECQRTQLLTTNSTTSPGRCYIIFSYSHDHAADYHPYPEADTIHLYYYSFHRPGFLLLWSITASNTRNNGEGSEA